MTNAMLSKVGSKGFKCTTTINLNRFQRKTKLIFVGPMKLWESRGIITIPVLEIYLGIPSTNINHSDIV